MTRRSAFGAALEAELRARAETQTAVAGRVGVSPAYLSSVMTGRRTASAEFADRVTEALRLGLDGRERLHRAAARDRGFRLDFQRSTD